MTLFVELLLAATYNEAAAALMWLPNVPQREAVRPANHLCRKPAIDDQVVAVDEARGIAGKKTVARAISSVSPAREIGCSVPNTPRTASATRSAFEPSTPAFLAKIPVTIPPGAFGRSRTAGGRRTMR
jgi:hypothetical protein